jgi:hypothetical protein
MGLLWQRERERESSLRARMDVKKNKETGRKTTTAAFETHTPHKLYFPSPAFSLLADRERNAACFELHTQDSR